MPAWFAGKASLACLHLLEALPGPMLAMPGPLVTPAIRKAFRGPLMVNGGYTADIIAYGVPFLANPDLVERCRTGAPDNPQDESHGPQCVVEWMRKIFCEI